MYFVLAHRHYCGFKGFNIIIIMERKFAYCFFFTINCSMTGFRAGISISIVFHS